MASTGGETKVSFDPNFQTGTYQLLELDDHLIRELGLAEGDEFDELSATRVFIRGEKNEEAVLCTSSKTFTIKQAEVSNSILLAVPGDGDATGTPSLVVQDRFSSFLELSEIAPRVEKIPFLLGKHKYKGPDYEDEENQLLDWRSLQNTVQASEDELIQGLLRYDAVQIDGKWRIFDDTYLSKFLELLTSTTEAQGWSYGSIPYHTFCDEIAEHDEFPRRVALRCLQIFATNREITVPASTAEQVPQGYTVAIASEKIAKFQGRFLLSLGGAWKTNQFMAAWQNLVPDDISLDLKLLDGLIVPDIEQATGEAVVRYFPRSSLSMNIRERFTQLFQYRPKWTLEELDPYLSDLVQGKQREAQLLKYTRVSTDKSGRRVYSSRY